MYAIMTIFLTLAIILLISASIILLIALLVGLSEEDYELILIGLVGLIVSAVIGTSLIAVRIVERGNAVKAGVAEYYMSGTTKEFRYLSPKNIQELDKTPVNKDTSNEQK